MRNMFMNCASNTTTSSKLSITTQFEPSASKIRFFACRLILPLSSPLREEIMGDVMPTKRLAKHAAALKACKLLHQLKELDDFHLQPVSRLHVIKEEEEPEEIDFESPSGYKKNGFLKRRLHSLKEEEEPEEIDFESPSVYKKTEVFFKRVPECLSDCRPLPNKPIFIYSIEFTSLKPCPSNSKPFNPTAVETKIGILTSKMIPGISAFPLITRAGTFQVTLNSVGSVLLNVNQVENLEKFHRFAFESVIFLGERRLEFNLESSKTHYLIAPLNKESHSIDFPLVEKILSSSSEWRNSSPEVQQYAFNPDAFVDTVVVQSYISSGTPYYVDRVTDLTPLSAFPNQKYQTYAQYYQCKYNIVLKNPEQHLLEVSREVKGKNFLLPR